MARIKLLISREVNPEIYFKAKEASDVVRLKAKIIFKKSLDDYTKAWDAIIDTGAPISVLPYEIWKPLDINILTTSEIRGIVPREECKIPADIGKLKCILIDEFGNKSKELEIFSYLAITNSIPIILGFKNLLDQFKIFIDCKNNQAYLEE